MSTLSDLVKDFGDEYIDYLKVDVESSEIKVNPLLLRFYGQEINMETLSFGFFYSSKAFTEGLYNFRQSLSG